MTKEITLTLNSPITDEQWDAITDVDFEHTDRIMFHTKHGKDVEFVKRKKGRWIKMSDGDGIYWACSECGEDIPRVSHYDPQFDLFPRLKSIEKTNFCPNCGEKMEGEQDED